jgi:hypothetical protein
VPIYKAAARKVIAPADASASTASAVPKQYRPWQWRKGQSGNPAGRKLGNRNRLSEAFLADLLEVWAEHGRRALELSDDHVPLTAAHR